MFEEKKKQSHTSTSKSETLPLLPLRDIVVFPSSVMPLFVGREKSIKALDLAMSQDKKIMLSAQKEAKSNNPSSKDIFLNGTIANILQLLKLPDGTVKVLVEGKSRAKIRKFINNDEMFIVETSEEKHENFTSPENEALVRTVRMAFDNYIRLNKRTPPEVLISISQIEDQNKLTDTLISHLPNIKLNDRQKLLEEFDSNKRLEIIYQHIQSEIEIMKTEKKIRARVKRQMEKTQKEYYLNEQMTAIQKELGDRDDGKSEIKEMEKLLENKSLSEEAREKAGKELKKLKYMPAMSAEATVVRNYLDTLLTLPWGVYTKDNKDINHAEDILNRDHFGLEKVKDRILEYLSIKNMVNEIKGPILCLVGPPGVGKTSLVKSIAEALDRNFVKIALGGVKDQAEIRGHRKTYIGSMPGKIISSLKKAGSANPVILLDEIDKLSMDHRGDPSAALLEVLDPEQNVCFNDHYLDVDFDLSKCLFVATANSVEGIPGPLLDRTELIRLSGYTEIEKLNIAQRFLIPKQLRENGFTKHKVNYEESAILEIVRYYTKEAGVRNLEREVSSVLRKIARKHMKKNPSKKSLANQKSMTTEKESKAQSKSFLISETVEQKSVFEYLGPRKYRISEHSNKAQIGVCTGLAWTPYGGEILVIEVATLPGKGKLIITGKLGETMQESAHAALSYVRSRAKFLGLDNSFYHSLDIHIHVPEGAIPKDGPSAGLCICTALTSAFTKRPIDQNVAMTGEITLLGRSLPIGGLKEKSLAAHRAGIKKIIFPQDNIKDLSDLPKTILKDLDFIPVSHMDEVLIHSLLWTGKENDKLKQKLKKNVKEISPISSLNLAQ